MLPWSEGNAYQTLLKQGVETAGGDVTPATIAQDWLSTLKQGHTDVLHLHWLHGLAVGRNMPRTLVKGASFLRKLSTARRHVRGIVWTCHNLGNHLGWSLGLERKIVRRACALFDRIIVHHESAVAEAVSYFDIPQLRDRFDVIPHGHYIGWYPNTATRQQARTSLEIPADEIVFLMFGQLRANKGIENLLAAFSRLCHQTSAPLRLILAGKADPEIHELIVRFRADEPRIDYRPGFVTEEAVQPFHAAADVAVFPFSSGLTSGSLILAMGFGLPIIAANMGDAKHLVDQQGGRLVASGSVQDLTRTMSDLIAAKSEWPAMGKRNNQLVAALRWDLIGEQTMECYRKAMDRDSR